MPNSRKKPAATKTRLNSFFIKSVGLLTTSILFTACSFMGVSDSSTDYKTTQVLPPLDMAGQTNGVLTPIYPLPPKPKASNTFLNKKGNRFVMPRPIPESLNKSVAASQMNTFNKALTENEKGVPIIQVQADQPSTINKVTEVLNALNYQVSTSNNDNFLIIANEALNGKRLLRFSNIGTVTTVMVTNPDATIANTNEARFILNAIDKGW